MSTPAARQRLSSLGRVATRRCLTAVVATATLVACGGGTSKTDKLADVLIDQAATAPATQNGAGDGANGTGSGGGGSVGVPVGTDQPDAGPTASPSDGAAPTATAQKQQIDKTVWWGGFKITVSSAEASSNALGATINVSVALENLTADVARLDRRNIVLTVGSQAYLAGLGQTPEVPPSARNDEVLDFLVDDTFVVDKAVLTFGQPDVNQAVVPFGPDAATSFEPERLTVDAKLATALETIQFDACTIDASYAPGEKGTFIVRLPLRATYTGGGTGGDLVTPDQFALESPSGSSVVGIAIAPGDIVAEPVYTGQDLTGKMIAFKLSALDSGTWTISYTDSTGKVATAEITVA